MSGLSGHVLDCQRSPVDGAYVLTVSSDAPEQLAEGLDSGTITIQVPPSAKGRMEVVPLPGEASTKEKALR